MSFDLTKNRARGRRRKGEGPTAAAAPAPEPEPRLSFAERFAHTLPAGGAAPMPGGGGEAQAQSAAPADRFSPRSDHAELPGGDGVSGAAAQAARDVAAGHGAARVSPRLGQYAGGSPGPYRVSRGGTQAAYAAGGLGATGGGRRHGGARSERFDVGRWAEGQREKTHAPTLKDFYSEIRTVH